MAAGSTEPVSVAPIQWCRDRLLVPGNPLVISLNFAPPGQQDRILAVRAVATEIAAIPTAVSDEVVAGNKLAWWQQALAGSAAHPAIQALEDSGAAGCIPDTAWQPLFQGVAESIPGPRFERFEELMDHCRRIGGALFGLEHAALEGADPVEPWLEMGASGYLFRIVRDLGLDARQGRWLVPLDLQAWFQVDRRQAEDGIDDPKWRGLVREMVQRGLVAGHGAARKVPPEAALDHRHLMVTHALDARLGRLAGRRPGVVLSRRLLPGRFGNLWTAWRTAVGISRPRERERSNS